MPSLARHEGYLLIDHRFSPGVPEDIALKSGYDPKMLREGQVLECATIHCAHCLGAVVKNPMRIRERGYCTKCDKYLCDHCDAKRNAPDYVHASGEQVSDTIINAAINGTILGSPIDLLNQPKIFVP
jgi:hypothetical protein